MMRRDGVHGGTDGGVRRSTAVVLVTGGAGFIGSNLCRTLLAEGHEVYAVDSFITGHAANIEDLQGNKKFHFHQLNICDAAFIELFRDIPVQKIFHLACPTGVKNIAPLSEEMILTSSIGTRHALEIARRAESTFVYSSSAEVYGNPLQFPQGEEYSGNVHPTGARSPYEEGKRFGESLVKLYAEKYNVATKIVRIFNTFGPGMSLDDQRVIPQFLRAVLFGEPLTIYGDGSQTRTHLYVDDLIRGLQTVLEHGCPGEVYNVGGEREMSVRELAEKMLSLSASAVTIVFAPHFIEDHTRRCPSTVKVRALGWEPQIGIDDGLARMISHYRIASQASVLSSKK